MSDEPRPMRGVVKVEPPPPGARSIWERVDRCIGFDPLAFNCGQVDEGWWFAALCVMEFVRGEPLQSNFCSALERAMLELEGVESVDHYDREVWQIDGAPDGAALAEAIAGVIDQFADEFRAIYYR